MPARKCNPPPRTPAHPLTELRAPAAGSYDRTRDLPGLLTLWPWEIASDLASRMRLVGLLRKALRVERQRGIAGHWTYDVGRHARLLQAYRAEQAKVRSLLAARSHPTADASANAKQPERGVPAAAT